MTAAKKAKNEKKKKNEMPAGAALSRFDPADYLKTPEARTAYLEAAFEDYGDDARLVAMALGDVARAQGMQKIARETGLNREGLYQALSGAGHPSFDTILKVMRAVGVELRPRLVSSGPQARRGASKAAKSASAGTRLAPKAPARKRA